MSEDGHYLLLSGGVGGSRMADGLAQSLKPGELAIVVNTGDDFRHLGLHIAPDIDTVTYMLAGYVDQKQGWGRRDETWSVMKTLQELNGPDWFRLGDRDLALHLYRSGALSDGQSLTSVTESLRKAMGVEHSIFPMTNDPVRTHLETSEGLLDFQSYFVANQCAPVVERVLYEGAKSARTTAQILAAFEQSNLRGIVIAPSNPLLSIGPILAVPEIAERLRNRRVPVLAVSPLIGGKAVKGPAAKIMDELGLAADASGIAEFYRDYVDILMVDPADATFSMPGMDIVPEDILMQDQSGRAKLARACLDRLAEGKVTS